MSDDDKVNILLVDDQPAKLLSYEVILSELGENIIKASSAREAFEQLLRTEVAVILVDVCMPELDGFELARLVRDHPRFQRTAIIFISAVLLADVDRLRAYELGAVDYVPVPVIPEVLRAKVNVFVELYRKTRQLEQLNRELETRVEDRTAALQASTAQLLQSERRRGLALKAGQMGSWQWDFTRNICTWDQGQYEIFGVGPEFAVTHASIRSLIHADDWPLWQGWFDSLGTGDDSFQTEFRVVRPDGTTRWCIGSAAASFEGNEIHISGVTIDITERRQAEERQQLLAREVDHRAKNALALVQSIVRLTRAPRIDEYVEAVEGRITALSRAHDLLARTRWQGADLSQLVRDELAPYQSDETERIRIVGQPLSLRPPVPQTLALAVHELATNAVKYGALSTDKGSVTVEWKTTPEGLALNWIETSGPATVQPLSEGFGLRVIKSSVERQLGGKAIFAWRPEGLTCNLFVPHKEGGAPVEIIKKVEEAPPNLVLVQPNAAPMRMGHGNRVLVIEDEALVALMTCEYLSDQGYSVIGPFRSTSDAMADVMHTQIDAAVLDINLDGELVYPVATILRDRGVPIVFISGYDAESVDDRFANELILNKPVRLEELGTMLNRARVANSKSARGTESVSAQAMVQ
jgi:PAS domain S-box-containing protein